MHVPVLNQTGRHAATAQPSSTSGVAGNAALRQLWQRAEG